MKVVLRYLLFSFTSFYFAQLLYFPFELKDRNLGILYIFAFMFITSLFSRNFLKIIKLPHEGIGFLLLNTLLHSVSLYLGMIFLQKYSFIGKDFPKYDLFDIISTPRVYLNEYTSLVFFSAVYCFLFGMMYFITWKEHKK